MGRRSAGQFDLGRLSLASLHERYPVCFLALARLVTEQRPLISQGQYFADLHLGLIPLEDQYAVGGQHPKALGKALAQVIPPVTGQDSVLGPQPAITPGAGQVGRIEHHQLEGAVLEGQAAKIHDHIGLNVQGPAITEHVLLVADIAKQGALVVFVEPEHAAAAAGIKDFGCGGH